MQTASDIKNEMGNYVSPISMHIYMQILLKKVHT